MRIEFQLPPFGTEKAQYTQNVHTLHFVAAYVVLGRFVYVRWAVFITPSGWDPPCENPERGRDEYCPYTFVILNARAARSPSRIACSTRRGATQSPIRCSCFILP